MDSGLTMQLPFTEPFDLVSTLESGQAHRWRKESHWYVGVIRGNLIKIIEYFKRNLTENTSIPVRGWDERLSTEQAERRLREIGVKPSQEKGRVDAAAAAIILQSYLDFKKYT